MPNATPPSRSKCLLCRTGRPGETDFLWCGFLVGSKEKRAFLSNTTTVTTTYRDLKRVDFYLCHACRRRAEVRATLPVVVGFALAAVAAGVGGAFVGKPNIQLGVWAVAGLAAVGAAFFGVLLAFPHLDPKGSESAVADRAGPVLRNMGHGDSWATDRAYQIMFLRRDPAEVDAPPPKTARELLAAAGETDDDRPRPARKKARAVAGGNPLDLTRCPHCAKATPTGRACKWCGEALP